MIQKQKQKLLVKVDKVKWHQYLEFCLEIPNHDLSGLLHFLFQDNVSMFNKSF
jgi:hypothetical protein